MKKIPNKKRPNKYYSVKYGQLEFTIGNLKLGTDTMIFNMGSALECPSLKLGLCKIENGRCYAASPEKMYPKCKPYRDRQAAYWLSNSADKIAADIIQALETKRYKDKKTGKLKPFKTLVKYFRFNESGDFYNQADVRKLNQIAGILKRILDIDTYGYTARSDLNFGQYDRKFNVLSSGWNSSILPKCIAVKPELLKGKKTYQDEHGTEYAICKMDCRKCRFCKTGKLNVAIPLH